MCIQNDKLETPHHSQALNRRLSGLMSRERHSGSLTTGTCSWPSSSRTREALAAHGELLSTYIRATGQSECLPVGVAAITTTTWSVTSHIPQASVCANVYANNKDLFYKKKKSVMA